MLSYFHYSFSFTGDNTSTTISISLFPLKLWSFIDIGANQQSLYCLSNPSAFIVSQIIEVKWNVVKSYEWYFTKDKNIKDGVEKWFIPLHGIEFLILLILSLFIIDNYKISLFLFNFVFCVLLGCIFHLILDLVVLIYKKGNTLLKISFIYNYIYNKLLLKNENNTKNLKKYQNQKV